MASPRFVARRGKDGNYVRGRSRRTSGPGAAADSFVTNAVLVEKGCELLTYASANVADYTIFG